MYITEIAIFFVTIFLWLLYKKYKSINNFYDKHPGPKPLFIFGNALDFAGNKDPLWVLSRYVDEFGSMVRMQIGPFDNTIIVTDPKFLEFLLGTTQILNKSHVYKFLNNWLGTGLLTTDGPKWKKHRKIINPAFHFTILEKFVAIFESNGNTMIQKLRQKSNQPIDVSLFVTLCSLDIICESMMGTCVDAQLHENSDYVQSVKEMCRIIVDRGFSLLKSFDLFYKFSRDYTIEKKSLNILHDYTNNVIDKKREDLNLTFKTRQIQTESKPTLLDLLLQVKKDDNPLTQTEIREEVDTFMFAGHDTTTAAISFCLFQISEHPEIQEKILVEQREIFGDSPNPESITYANLQEMKYLDCVIKETLRLFPSVPFYARQADKNVKYYDTIIPKGTRFLIFAYGLHRNPKYFQNPKKFDPTRFEDSEANKLSYIYIPFSSGPRSCIGQKFAILEMKSVISKIVRNFEILPTNPPHKLKIIAETTLKSSNGIVMKLKLKDFP